MSDDGPYCARCGSNDMEHVDCQSCGGEGGFDRDDLIELDPLWYDGVDWEDCDECHGSGGHWTCWTCVEARKRKDGAA